MKNLFFILVLVLLVSCESPNSPETNIVEGYITMVGNMPFPKIAITTNTNTYLLSCPKQIEKLLYKEQGNLYRIYYIEKYQSVFGETIIVSKNVKIVKISN